MDARPLDPEGPTAVVEISAAADGTVSVGRGEASFHGTPMEAGAYLAQAMLGAGRPLEMRFEAAEAAGDLVAEVVRAAAFLTREPEPFASADLAVTVAGTPGGRDADGIEAALRASPEFADMSAAVDGAARAAGVLDLAAHALGALRDASAACAAIGPAITGNADLAALAKRLPDGGAVRDAVLGAGVKALENGRPLATRQIAVRLSLAGRMPDADRRAREAACAVAEAALRRLGQRMRQEPERAAARPVPAPASEERRRTLAETVHALRGRLSERWRACADGAVAAILEGRRPEAEEKQQRRKEPRTRGEGGRLL